MLSPHCLPGQFGLVVFDFRVFAPAPTIFYRIIQNIGNLSPVFLFVFTVSMFNSYSVRLGSLFIHVNVNYVRING